MRWAPFVLLLLSNWTGAFVPPSPVRLEPDRLLVQQADRGVPGAPVSARGIVLHLGWRPEPGSPDRRLLPGVLAAAGGRASEPTVVFRASQRGSVYWGRPVRVFWLLRGDRLWVELVEYSRLGSPAYRACLLIGLEGAAPRLLESAEPGRDHDRPAWAAPLDRAIAGL